MAERMGQQIVIDNRAGASGQIGLELLKNATPDGYTIGVGQGGTLVVAPHTYKKLPYDPLKDFTAVALNATNYLAVVANPNVPILQDAHFLPSTFDLQRHAPSPSHRHKPSASHCNKIILLLNKLAENRKNLIEQIVDCTNLQN